MRGSEHSAAQGIGRLAAAAFAVASMAACLDGVQGYPQQQAPIISPYDMTQEQRLVR